VENVLLTQDFTNLQNENEKPDSGLLPVQFMSPQFVCIVVLQHKSEWMGFLTVLISRLQGRMRLDGARGKISNSAPPFSNLRPSGSKCTILKNVRVTLLRFFGAPAIIRRHRLILEPPEWFGDRVIAPPCPFVTPLLIEPQCSVWKATDVYGSKQLAAMWQKCL